MVTTRLWLAVLLSGLLLGGGVLRLGMALGRAEAMRGAVCLDSPVCRCPAVRALAVRP